MSYRIAGIDVHKKILAVVVSDVEVDDEFHFERRWFASNPEQLRSLAAWLLEQEAEEVVMESTAQYWKPVWGALERYWKPTRKKREGAKRRSGTLHLGSHSIAGGEVGFAQLQVYEGTQYEILNHAMMVEHLLELRHCLLPVSVFQTALPAHVNRVQIATDLDLRARFTQLARRCRLQ